MLPACMKFFFLHYVRNWGVCLPAAIPSTHPYTRSLATEGRDARKPPVIGSAGCRGRLHVFTAERRCQCTTSPARFIQPGIEVNFGRVLPETPVQSRARYRSAAPPSMTIPPVSPTSQRMLDIMVAGNSSTRASIAAVHLPPASETS